MTDGDPMRDAAREYKRPTAATRPDVPVAGLLRDAIVGITCFLTRCRRAASGAHGDGGSTQSARDVSAPAEPGGELKYPGARRAATVV
jgi:hypothetical protein